MKFRVFDNTSNVTTANDNNSSAEERYSVLGRCL